MRENTRAMFNTTTFGVGRRVIKPGNAGMGNRTSTHGARFERNPQVAIGQAIGAKCCARSANGHDFGVRSRIIAAAGGVGACRNNVTTSNDDCADWHFSV
jgi:hypothetical protein